MYDSGRDLATGTCHLTSPHKLQGPARGRQPCHNRTAGPWQLHAVTYTDPFGLMTCERLGNCVQGDEGGQHLWLQRAQLALKNHLVKGWERLNSPEGITAFALTIGGGAAPGSKVGVPENAFLGPVTRRVFIADSKGNVIPAEGGQRLTGSPDGKWIQVRGTSGEPTGMRLDGAHGDAAHRGTAGAEPHAHVPGVANPDGTPWLPVHQ
jgi:hypothetical protein